MDFLAGYSIAIAGFIVDSAMTLAHWAYNICQPTRTAHARVLYKWNKASDKTAHHYVTFELSKGGRKELKVPINVHYLFAEGEYGNLEYKGTRFQSFSKNLP